MTQDNALFEGTFESFNLPSFLTKGLDDLGYKLPTKVQSAVYKSASEGRNLLVQSHTGSGKTTAFALPLLAAVDLESPKPQALIVVPTRELCRQVATECTRLSFASDLKVLPIYGGVSISAQIAGLKGSAQIIVATPGRLLDLIKRKALDPTAITKVVLDEADEMLSMGFWDDIVNILGHLPKEKQTLLFSATLPSTIEHALAKILKDEVRIDLSSDVKASQSIRHIVHREDEMMPKVRSLLYALATQNPGQALIFCNRRDETESVANYLSRFGFKLAVLNGDMAQNERERAMDSLRSGELDALVATDVAARGIDISGITHVFNYELPDNDESYIHRTGRTGRIGKSGTAVSLIRGKNLPQVESIQTKYELTLEDIAMPRIEEVMTLLSDRMAMQLGEESESVEISQFLPLAESMLKRGDIQELLAFLLKKQVVKVVGLQKKAPTPQRTKPPRAPERKSRPQAERKEKREAAPEIIEAKEDTQPQVQDELDLSDGPKLKPAPVERVEVNLGNADGLSDLAELALFLSKKSGISMGAFSGGGSLHRTQSTIDIDQDTSEALLTAMLTATKEGLASSSDEKITCEIKKNRYPIRSRGPKRASPTRT